MSILMRFPEGKTKVFTMSYDDGVFQDIRLIEIMSQHGLKGTFNINSGQISETDANLKGRLSKKQIKELYLPSGNEVALHTYTHPYLTGMSPERITYEYLKDKETMEELTDTIIRGSALPFSAYNDNVIASIKACGVDYSRNGTSTESFAIPDDWLYLSPTCRHNNPKLFDLADKFINTDNSWRPCSMFYLMGHSYEFDNDNNWDLIENFSEKISGHSDIWYATNIEIYDYIQSYNSVRYNLSQTLAQNPSATDVWIFKNGKIIKIKAGETISI